MTFAQSCDTIADDIAALWTADLPPAVQTALTAAIWQMGAARDAHRALERRVCGAVPTAGGHPHHAAAAHAGMFCE